MKTVLETCIPRPSILRGTFNPEVFTASLGPVIQFYRGASSTIDAVYTDARMFFTNATYPTEGLKQTVSNVFRRIAGDQTVPSIQRMETAFGGGKTHSLIACVHIANLGTELADVTDDILEAEYLPEPHTVTVVGIAGDEIPVNKIKGDRLIPYTLWGELAYQVGGEALYKSVKTEAESFAAPGKHFLETVLAGKKVLIMLDELAQYAARLEVAVPGRGADQLAAFLMALDGFAKTHAGIALVVTLAGSADAFSRQTESLTRLLNSLGGEELRQDDAVALAERASRGVTSVVMRDATAVTPVTSNEISAVLAKRLFTSIDKSASYDTIEAYAEVYQRNPSLLPEAAVSVRFWDRMVENYPFHPTLIDFLNNKLAQAENFQGTRGVLRTLAMTVRSIWNRQMRIPLIHVGDIDMQNNAIVNELLGRTGSADLRQVLNADIGSVDTSNLQGGLSNAQLADARNPHPDGLPFYEMTWKVVFLNSLVGRTEGKASKVFGISQQDAIFQLTTPLLAPSQVRTALDEIAESAFYLRYEDGKYYAHVEPTINSILARIRQTIDDRQVQHKLRNVANQLVTDFRYFHVEHDVHSPQDISDTHERLTVAVVSLNAGEINVREMFQLKGDSLPRIHQNTIILLVPKTVKVVGAGDEQTTMDLGKVDDDAITRVDGIARQVLAIETLKGHPEAYGVTPKQLQDPEFVGKDRERPIALQTAVGEMYNGFYFYGQSGYERRELRTASGERGTTILTQIQQILQEAGKLVYSDNGRYGSARLRLLGDTYFFKADDKMPCAEIYSHFLDYRTWPMLPERGTLVQLIREGVESGCWVVYRRSEDPTDSLPADFFSDKKPMPYNVELLNGGYSLMTVAGAKKRGWTQSNAVPNEKVKEAIRTVMASTGAATVADLTHVVQSQHANATEEQVQDNIRDLIQSGGFSLYAGQAQQKSRPAELVTSFGAYSHTIHQDEVLISRAEETERGWNTAQRGVSYTGSEGAEKIARVLKRLGSLYTRGSALSDVDELDISDLRLLSSNATIRVQIEGATAADMKRLDEFFQELANVARFTDRTEADIQIRHPQENCALVKELKK